MPQFSVYTPARISQIGLFSFFFYNNLRTTRACCNGSCALLSWRISSLKAGHDRDFGFIAGERGCSNSYVSGGKGRGLA